MYIYIYTHKYIHMYVYIEPARSRATGREDWGDPRAREPRVEKIGGTPALESHGSRRLGGPPSVRGQETHFQVT